MNEKSENQSSFYTGINIALSMSTLGGLAFGIGSLDIFGTQISTWLFAFFFFLFRLKVLFEDHPYFSIEHEENPVFLFGLIVRIGLWVLLMAAAVKIGDLIESYFVLLIVFFVSTLWLIIEVVIKNQDRRQYTWIIFNSIYSVILGILIWCSLHGHYVWEQILLTTMILVHLWDWKTSEALSPRKTHGL